MHRISFRRSIALPLPVFCVLLAMVFALGIAVQVEAETGDESQDEPAKEPEAAPAGDEAEDPHVSKRSTGYQKPEDLGPIRNYARWIRYTQDMFLSGEIDLWGSSATVPQGFLVGAFGWGTMRPGGRFSENRQEEDLLPILEVPDPFNDDGKWHFFRFDFRASGSAQGYFAGFMYGITDNLMVGVNTMWTVLHIRIDPIFEPGSSQNLGVATLDEFYTLLELLGRPRPKLRYDSDVVDFGDTTLSATWNYFRNDWFSTGFTTNLFIPTAHRADPDQSLIFGLGPDIDSGNSAWGLGLVKMFDFRPPKPLNVVTFSFGLEGAAFLQSKRKSPNFYKPNQDVWDYMSAQGVELDFLPDLSDMDSHYYYTPPPWVAVSAGIGAGPISVTYRHGWGFEASFESNSPGFRAMLDEIGLVGTGDDGKIIVAASLPLTPLYLPALVQFRTEYQTDGRNNIIFRDIYQLGVGFFIPINPPNRYKVPRGYKPTPYKKILGVE